MRAPFSPFRPATGAVPSAPLPRIRSLAVLTCVLALGACAGRGPHGANRPAPDDAPERVGNALVVHGGSFEGRTDLLQVLSSRISSMEVNRRGPCPDIIFRGRSSLQGSSSARVYVNGQPAVNTCVLEMVSSWDVDRVEVYPSGIVRRPGYPVSSTGSILVFTKRGEVAPEPATN